LSMKISTSFFAAGRPINWIGKPSRGSTLRELGL
jgi:hypothetical protein